MTNSKQDLKYQDLQLGERAVQAFKKNRDPILIAKTLPTYLNTRDVYRGSLTTTDLLAAAYCGGINTFLMGKRGTGKSQWAEDASRYYAGGKLNQGGESFITEAHNDFELEPLFVKFDTQTGEKRLKGTHEAVFYVLEELTRAHSAVQTQFYSFGNGRFIMNGFDEQLGREGFSCAVATGNDPRADENTGGRFDIDPAFLSRFALVLDLDNEHYRLTEEDRFWIKRIKPANPGLTFAKKGKNLTDKVIQAHKQIQASSANLGLESEAVFSYLENLRTCPGLKDDSGEQTPRDKEDISWPNSCLAECQRKSSDTREGSLSNSPLCGLIKAPDSRILSASRLYAAALDFILKLKEPEKERDPVDVSFLAFELIGAYQGVLNGITLQSDFGNKNNTMMRQVVDHLKDDFRENQDYICQTFEKAKQGKEVAGFFIQGGDYLPTPVDKPQLKKIEGKIDAINAHLGAGKKSSIKGFSEGMGAKTSKEIFTDKREVPLGWVPREAKLIRNNRDYLEPPKDEENKPN